MKTRIYATPAIKGLRDNEVTSDIFSLSRQLVAAIFKLTSFQQAKTRSRLKRIHKCLAGVRHQR